tara:strand:- start:38 stop:427 length:390 start_codon:yes stop_codon:yes gene_type:complete
LIPKRKNKSKYYAKKVKYDGITFDSKLEGARYKILKDMQDRGQISDLELQVPYECVVEGKKICKYFADFRYRCGEDVIVEDTKGVITQVFTLKKKLVEALYPELVIQIIVDPREPPRTEFYPHPLHAHG